MRKPLLLISVVCCLLLSATTPLTLAMDWEDPENDSIAVLSLGPWFGARLFFELPLLPAPIRTNIFNDGPDPVGSSEGDDGDDSDDDPEQDGAEGGPIPLDSVGNGNLTGARE